MEFGSKEIVATKIPMRTKMQKGINKEIGKNCKKSKGMDFKNLKTLT